MVEIKSFRIKKLYGERDIHLKFKGNVLIIVGENGSGKTTILRIIYLFLSGRWSTLLRYIFDEISVSFIDNKEISVKREQIYSSLQKTMKDSPFFNGTSLLPRRNLLDLLEEDFESSTLLKREYFNRIHYDWVKNTSSADLFLSKHLETLRDLLKKMKEINVLYLPTYRRIEKELSAIFHGIDEDELRNKKNLNGESILSKSNSFEIVEFGMRDIKSSIKRVSAELNRFAVEELNHLTLHYLSDIVDQKYKDVNISSVKKEQIESIESVLKRINSEILPQTSRNRLSATISDIRLKVQNKKEFNDHEKVIFYYITKLLDFQKKLDEKETRIKKFCEVCNSYIIDKHFYYDSSSFMAYLHYNDKKRSDIKKTFDLESLSSGEKQIVSLFGTLYLASEEHFFILIDEPELSLSVPWQRKFLVDVSEATCCAGLIAVTHSPFIFQNKLDPNVHGLNEFVSER